VIASVSFRNYKALRNTQLTLAPFNLVIGPNGSGKSSLIQAVMRLRELAAGPVMSQQGLGARAEDLEVIFRFAAPFGDTEARLACSGEFVCSLLQVRCSNDPAWSELRDKLMSMRSYVLDHSAIARGTSAAAQELEADGKNLAARLREWQRAFPDVYRAMETEFCRILPEFVGLGFREEAGRVTLQARLADGACVPAENMSQGTLYLLAMLALAFDPSPPSVLCIEEIDRGIHPRMLREVRDALYRLSYPSAFGLRRRPVQLIATTHSPYLLDLFRDHPEEIVIAHKQGTEARFERLSERADIHELLQEGSLGDMWYAGILGGVPEENLGQFRRTAE
jgi:predicted ATPase